MKIRITNHLNKRFIMKKNEEKILIQKQNKRCMPFRVLVISYVELENKLKAMEGKLKINDSEKH